ncbi:MAG: Gfo/Idh/MocA family protein [Candidatus Helarchaeota archaeon]
MKRLKIGIVGFGWFGKKHYAVWKDLEFVEVVAIADKNIENVAKMDKSLQEKFHVESSDLKIAIENIPLYKSVEELLTNEEVDAIDIVVDEKNHYSVAKTALEYGKHIIVEKPFVTKLQHALDLTSIAKREKKKIFVGHILRFDRRNRYIKDYIEAGKLGDIRYLSFKRNFQSVAHKVYGRTHPFFSAMIHDIDLALWFTGKKVINAYAYTKHLLGHENPDVLIAIIEFENNILCRIENIWHVSSSCPYGFEYEIALYGSKSTVIQSNTPDIKVWAESRVEYPELFFWPVIGDKVGGALREELAHFAKCILEGRSSEIIPIDDVKEGIRVAKMLRKSGGDKYD